MRLVLIGYGKMGRMVEKVAQESGHEITGIVDPQTHPGSGFSDDWQETVDALIDFSVGAQVPSNVENGVKRGIPVVVGTTGWNEELDKVRMLVNLNKGTCIHSSNFSVGVQALFHLANQAGKLISRFEDFHPYIVESHHIQKVDAPSGTALTLRQSLEQSYGSEVPISSVRAGFFPGEHTVGFDSPVDTLTLQHSARSREGFARGAVFAASWAQGKIGFYSFEEILFREDND